MNFRLSDRLLNYPDVRRFFVGWARQPSQAVFEQLLNGADLIVLALEHGTDAPIGFVTAITDKAMCAYIPLLEVVPEHQGSGVGSAMVRRMLKRLENYYAIDVVCDESVESFYAQFGMKRRLAMSLRNHHAIHRADRRAD